MIVMSSQDNPTLLKFDLNYPAYKQTVTSFFFVYFVYRPLPLAGIAVRIGAGIARQIHKDYCMLMNPVEAQHLRPSFDGVQDDLRQRYASSWNLWL